MNLSPDHPMFQALAWTLLHFLWQGALLGLGARALLWLLRDRSPQLRYLVGCAAMTAMAAAPVVTFILLKPAAAADSSSVLVDTARVAAVLAAPARAGAPSLVRELSLLLRPLLPWAVALWLGGVTLLSLRLLGGWVWLLRLRTRLAEPAGACWQMTLNALSRRMRVKMDVRILRSWAVDTPMVVGWVKPLILVPAAALAGLAPEALEAILAHELAHVRRHDYLVNLVQSVVEVLLFYHPAVWWISAQVRQERELCCDDAAVDLCGDPVLYARALAALEGLRGDTLPETRLAPAAHGGTLMTRIQRLLSPSLPPSPTRRAGILAALAVTALGAGTVLRLQDNPPKAEHRTEPAEGKRKSMIMISEDSGRLRVKTQGEVKVRPETGIDLQLADGASIEISDTEKDTVRRFKASREQGAEKRSFTVNGKEAPVDKAWLDQRLDQLKKLDAKTAAAREKAKLTEGKARDAEEKARHIEVRVRKLDKDGQESEEVRVLPGPEGRREHQRIIVKKVDGSGHAEIETLPGHSKPRIFMFKSPDGEKLEIDAERMSKDALEHVRSLKLHMKDLGQLREHLKDLKPDLDLDFDFDFDMDDVPHAFRWDGTTPSPEHLEKIKELKKRGQEKEVEVLRHEIERLQHRLDRLQERMHEDGTPVAPPKPPRPPKPPAAHPGPTPKPSATVPPPPPAPRTPPAAPAPPAPPKAPTPVPSGTAI